MISPKTSDLCPLFSKHDALHLLFLTKSLFSDKRWLANQELVFPDVIGRRVWHFRRNVPPQHHTSTKIGSSVQLLLIFTCRLIESNRACINFHKNIYKSTTDWLHHSEDCHLENLKLAVEKSGKHWVTQEIPVDEIYSQLWCIFSLQKKKKKTLLSVTAIAMKGESLFHIVYLSPWQLPYPFISVFLAFEWECKDEMRTHSNAMDYRSAKLPYEVQTGVSTSYTGSQATNALYCYNKIRVNERKSWSCVTFR